MQMSLELANSINILPQHLTAPSPEYLLSSHMIPCNTARAWCPVVEKFYILEGSPKHYPLENKGEALCQTAMTALHTQAGKMAFRGKQRHLVLRSLLLMLQKSSDLHASLSALERH